MRQWQKDALSVIREARTHATHTSNTRLHLACSRTIVAVVAEGGQVSSDLRCYALKILELYGLESTRENESSASSSARW
jgi:hypothetical protein